MLTVERVEPNDQALFRQMVEGYWQELMPRARTFFFLELWMLAAILLFEVAVTLSDFIEEDRTRRLPAGERAMHALMGIVYGVFLTLLLPHAAGWWRLDSGFGSADYGPLSWLLTFFAAGVLSSGIRDLVASARLG